MDFSIAFIQIIQYTEVTSNKQKSYRCFHCARLESKYCNSVSTNGALHHFQYHSCEEIFYFLMDFCTTFIQNIQYTEVTSDQQELYRWLHCARLESKYWNSVFTFGALLHFLYLSWEEIVFFSMDPNPDFVQYVFYPEVTADQQRWKQYFHCARLESTYCNSVSTFRALLHFQYYSCEELVYFSMDFSTAFIQNILYTDVSADLQRSNRCFHCARLESTYWNSVSTLGHLFTFSTTAVRS